MESKKCKICEVDKTPQWYSGPVCKKCYRDPKNRLGKTPSSCTPDLIEKVIQMRKNGKSSAEITKQTGISKSKIFKIFKEKGLVLDKQVKNKLIASRWANYNPIVDNKKKCCKCKELKEKECFSVNKNAKSGLHHMCKTCVSNVYFLDSDSVKKRVNAYRVNNPEKKRAADRAYYLKNQNHIKEKVAFWQKNNIDKKRQYAVLEQKRNIANRRAGAASRRAALKNATPKWLTEEHKKQIKDFYKNQPQNFHVDHIVPLAGENISGLHVPWNLQYLPEHANEAKGNKFFDHADLYRSECFQHVQRKNTEKEDRLLGMPFDCKINDFIFARERITKEHVYFIQRYEWLGSLGYAPKWVFTARFNGVLGGVVTISEPSQFTKNKDIEAQIHRGACASWTPKNLASKLIMFSCKWVVQNTPKRVFFAYVDPEAGEIGTIYQACNFDYMGHYYGGGYFYETPEGKILTSRALTNTYSFKKWCAKAGVKIQGDWIKPNGYQNVRKIPSDIMRRFKDFVIQYKSTLKIIIKQPKGKYAIILGKTKAETKKLKKTYRFWTPLPYIKRPS